MCARDIEFTYFYDFSIECWNCSDSVIYIFSFYYRLCKKNSWVAIVKKKYGCDRLPLFKSSKWNTIELISNGDLFQPHLKYTLTLFHTCTICSRSLITKVFHSIVHFLPVLVKGFYQTESYSLHVMQLIRI